ncbi:MAG TPA: CoA transferase [Caulobacteraceae bacterium]|jgi:2-methylfumaryl-CoA isomerase|nr:CoA transferase [Caulobacteraceae bacterium]
MDDLLKGLRVVEAAAFVAGPSCALHLAQFGAQVIRIDQIGGGPDFRRWPLAPGGEASLYWEGLNKAKRSVALDLSRPEGRELAQRLIAAPGENGGLFVTNYPVDGFLSHERLCALRADLVSVRIMGWADGRTAVDYTVNAAVGVPAMTGPAGDPRPVNHVLPAWDLMAGAYGAFALVSAERARRLDGRGREVRVPLSDIAIASLGHLGQIAEVALSGADRPRSGNSLFGAFGRDFVAADGARLMIAAITPRQWTGLVESLGVRSKVALLEAELGVSFDRDEGVRFTHRERLEPLIEAGVAARASVELGPVFDARGVCWSRYRTLGEALAEDPQLSAANPLLARVTQPSGETYLAPGAAGAIAGAPRLPLAAAPHLGQHTDEVLHELLGLGSGEIGRLHDAGLVSSATA